MGNGVQRPYKIPEEDSEPHVLTITRGDLEIFENALSLYSLWLKESGTLLIEGQEDFEESADPERERILQRLRELNITPRQLAIELKAGARSHTLQLLEMVNLELTGTEVDET